RFSDRRGQGVANSPARAARLGGDSAEIGVGSTLGAANYLPALTIVMLDQALVIGRPARVMITGRPNVTGRTRGNPIQDIAFSVIILAGKNGEGRTHAMDQQCSSARSIRIESRGPDCSIGQRRHRTKRAG